MAARRFEYEITIDSQDTFNELVYFCTSSGECEEFSAPADMTRALSSKLNDRGRDGWELVQITFASAGVVAVWKRETS